ncbi:hypothetical protein EFM24_05010 [Limosilactobacillus fermentum]|uniref:hypothetical protein n=1 Tax=Limosilactobacillus fermentum TaxID=1613 RepID=UPI0021A706C4|nr:hypothetical protein [Limosilactobacillus fermentum]MCT2875085.1 hypothetical protein [Limosilactobacillus fermentum]
MQVDEVVIPVATSFTWDDTSQNLILIVLAGHLFFNDQVAGPDQTLVVPAGQTTTLTVDGQEALHALLMVRQAPTMLAAPLLGC